MNDTPSGLPDRLSSDRPARTTMPALLARDIGVRFKGVERTNVRGILRQRGVGSRSMTVGTFKDRHGTIDHESQRFGGTLLPR